MTSIPKAFRNLDLSTLPTTAQAGGKPSLDANSGALLVGVNTLDDRYYTETEVDAALTAKADAVHTHDDRYYTETEVDAALAAKANLVHTHDDRYYTEGEVNAALATKASFVHTHDDRYYTEGEVDAALATKASSVHNHAGGDITSGTVAAARLGSGTADATTFLRGDNTWQTPTASDPTKQPLDATLTAFAGVVTAANKLVYANGVDSFTTADLSAYAITLLDDANAGAARTTLGLGTIATAAAGDYVLKAGDTMSGILIVQTNQNYRGIQIIKGGGGNECGLTFTDGANNATIGQQGSIFAMSLSPFVNNTPFLQAKIVSSRSSVHFTDATVLYGEGKCNVEQPLLTPKPGFHALLKGVATTEYAYRASEGNTYLKDAFSVTYTGVATSRSFVIGNQTSLASVQREQAAFVGSWIDSTDATRKGQFEEKVYDTAARTVRRVFANGTHGYVAHKVNSTAPADADLQNSELVFFDNAGTPSWKFKNSSGTVTTGAL